MADEVAVLAGLELFNALEHTFAVQMHDMIKNQH